jgi:fibronectin-binding autotransporter adhesin
MKNKLMCIGALCGAIATTSAVGQVTQIWTGAGDGTNLAVAANWGGTLPNTANNDTGEWNGAVPGNLVLHYNNPNANFQSGPGSSGVNFYLAGAQTGSVQILNDVFSPPYLAITDVQIDPGAGSFILGDTNTANTLWVIGRPSGAVHTYINNSTSPAIINPRVRFAAGGGAVWTLDFQGTGNWYCTNYLCNDNGPGMNIELDGPGNLYWNASDPREYVDANGIQSPVVINGGTLVLTGNHPKLNSQAFTLNGNFEFNAASQAQILTGVFSGSGTNIVNAGTLTLSGQSSYTGDTVLSGGELIVNGAENPGVSGPLGLGTIDFNGGTLGYSLNDTFDYSSRFSTAANEGYSIDTAGQSITFATSLSSIGGSLTKLGSGSLTLAGANNYSGLTTVSLGKLVLQGTKSGSANITVADGASLGIVENGSQVTPGTLTVGAVSGATLEFNNVTNKTTPPLAAGTIVSAGAITININSGSFNTIGQSFPLFSWGSGSAPAVTLGAVSGAAGTLATNGNVIVLTITSTPYVWTGGSSGSWDTSSTGNWLQSGNPVIFGNGALALLDDTATGATSLTVSGVVQPASVTVNNNSLAYSIASSGGNDIGGFASLTKNGGSSLTLSGGGNSYSGVTTINGGLVSVGTLANSGTPSDIGAAGNSASNLVLNGGTLQYTGSGASINHMFTIGPSGGAIDASGSGALSLTNTGTVALNGSGPHTLTLTGSAVTNNTIALNIVNSSGGATALTKDSLSTWVLTGTNTYSGLTTVNNGVLQVGAGGASGTLGSGNVVDNSGLDFNRTGTLTVSGSISVTGSVTNDGSGTVILTGNDNYSGGTAINAGVVQLGNGGASGQLYPNGSITINSNSVFILDSTTPLSISGYLTGIQGTGNLIVRSGCSLTSIDDNTYTGWTEIDSGATFQPCYGNEGMLVSSVITNNGTLLVVRQDNDTFGYTNNIVGSGKVVKENNNANTGDFLLDGTNTYTGGTWLKGGGLILGDGITPGAGSIVGPVIFTNTSTAFLNGRYLMFDRPDSFTFTNNIISAVSDGSSAANSGYVAQVGPGIVTLTGNDNYPGGLYVGTGTLQIGNGNATGGPSTIGAITITNSGVLVFDRSDSVTVSGAIVDGAAAGNGPGSLVQFGPGTLTFNASNSYTGPTTISNGTLVAVSGTIGGDLDLEGGTFIAGGTSTPITNSVAGNLNVNSGTMVVGLNKSFTPSNTTFVVTGAINSTGGTLILTNYGPSLAVGDKFNLFGQAVSGTALTIKSTGFTVANNLAVDGSVTVTSVVPTSVKITASYSGGVLNLSWPAGSGLHLQAETNSLSVGLNNNWVNVSGVSGNTYQATPNSTSGAVFYRLSQ